MDSIMCSMERKIASKPTLTIKFWPKFVAIKPKIGLSMKVSFERRFFKKR